MMGNLPLQVQRAFGRHRFFCTSQFLQPLGHWVSSVHLVAGKQKDPTAPNCGWVRQLPEAQSAFKLQDPQSGTRSKHFPCVQDLP